MRAWSAGLIGLVVGVALGAGGIVILHHAGPFACYGGAGESIGDRAPPSAATESPAYLVVLGEVFDRDAFMRDYAGKLPPLYEKYGGQYVAVGRNFEVLEGAGTFKSFVVSKWPSMRAVRAFWTDPEYEALRRARIAGNWGRFDVYALEGLAEPRASASPPK